MGAHGAIVIAPIVVRRDVGLGSAGAGVAAALNGSVECCTVRAFCNRLCCGISIGVGGTITTAVLSAADCHTIGASRAGGCSGIGLRAVGASGATCARQCSCWIAGHVVVNNCDGGDDGDVAGGVVGDAGVVSGVG